MNRRNIPDSIRYKEINGEKHKICLECEEYFPMTNDYFYNNKSNKKDGLNTYCIHCVFKRAQKWVDDNPEKYKEQKLRKVENKTDIQRQRSRDAANKNRKEGYQKKWRKEHPDKIREYNKDRQTHKKHEISDEEWFDCLDFFDNSCAYCGLSEEKQYEMYNEQFHKEHVIHNGSNYIDNCVPACTSCNVTKNIKEFNEWYNEDNPNFTEDRLDKIVKWMTEECFKTLNII
jgi:hypothetical protein